MNVKIVESLCLWCDLLGFSQPFIESSWDLNNPVAQKNIKRVQNLQYSFLSTNLYPHEKSLVLNDGFVKNIDLNKNIVGGVQSYIYWLTFLLNNYNIINTIDKEDGFPGVRGVLTYGHRFHYLKNNLTLSDILQSSPERKKEAEKEILVYSPLEFQMNTAFSKAYLMESGGSRIGLSGPNLFIDYEFIHKYTSIIVNTKNSNYMSFTEVSSTSDSATLTTSKTPVTFRSDFYEDNDFINWEIFQKVHKNESLLFKIWLDKNVIAYDNKGINTKIYRLVKYKPFDEEDFIIEL